MVESIFRENGYWDQKLHNRVESQNRAFRKAWEQLEKVGYKNLFYLSNEYLIGNDHEATIDGVHLSDLGHFRMAQELGRVIRQVLNIPSSGNGASETSLENNKITKP
jgi:lysophospholipase L1-like esterase